MTIWPIKKGFLCEGLGEQTKQTWFGLLVCNTLLAGLTPLDSHPSHLYCRLGTKEKGSEAIFAKQGSGAVVQLQKGSPREQA